MILTFDLSPCSFVGELDLIEISEATQAVNNLNTGVYGALSQWILLRYT